VQVDQLGQVLDRLGRERSAARSDSLRTQLGPTTYVVMDRGLAAGYEARGAGLPMPCSRRGQPDEPERALGRRVSIPIPGRAGQRVLVDVTVAMIFARRFQAQRGSSGRHTVGPSPVVEPAGSKPARGRFGRNQAWSVSSRIRSAEMMAQAARPSGLNSLDTSAVGGGSRAGGEPGRRHHPQGVVVLNECSGARPVSAAPQRAESDRSAVRVAKYLVGIGNGHAFEVDEVAADQVASRLSRRQRPLRLPP